MSYSKFLYFDPIIYKDDGDPSYHPTNYLYLNPEIEIMNGYKYDILEINDYNTNYDTSNPKVVDYDLFDSNVLPEDFNHELYIKMHQDTMELTSSNVFSLFDTTYNFTDYIGSAGSYTNSDSFIYTDLIIHNPRRIAIIHYLRIGAGLGLEYKVAETFNTNMYYSFNREARYGYDEDTYYNDYVDKVNIYIDASNDAQASNTSLTDEEVGDLFPLGKQSDFISLIQTFINDNGIQIDTGTLVDVTRGLQTEIDSNNAERIFINLKTDGGLTFDNGELTVSGTVNTDLTLTEALTVNKVATFSNNVTFIDDATYPTVSNAFSNTLESTFTKNLKINSNILFDVDPWTTAPSTAAYSLDMKLRNDGISCPRGTTDDRPVGEAGLIRFNTDKNEMEVYNGTEWSAISGGGLDTVGIFYLFSEPDTHRLYDQNQGHYLDTSETYINWTNSLTNANYVNFTNDGGSSDSIITFKTAVKSPFIIEFEAGGDFEIQFGITSKYSEPDTITTIEPDTITTVTSSTFAAGDPVIRLSSKSPNYTGGGATVTDDPLIHVSYNTYSGAGTAYTAFIDVLTEAQLSTTDAVDMSEFEDVITNEKNKIRHTIHVRPKYIAYHIGGKQVATATLADDDEILLMHGVKFISGHSDFNLYGYSFNFYEQNVDNFLYKSRLDIEATYVSRFDLFADGLQTGAIQIPVGTTLERDDITPELGMIRYNSDNGVLEGYLNTDSQTAWYPFRLANALEYLKVIKNGYIGEQLVVGASNADHTTDALYVKGNVIITGDIKYNSGDGVASSVLDAMNIIKTDVNTKIEHITEAVSANQHSSNDLLQVNNDVQIQGNVRIGNYNDTPDYTIDCASKSDAILLPKGTSNDRITATVVPVAGLIRYNTEISEFEGCYGNLESLWKNLVKAADTDNGIQLLSDKYALKLKSVSSCLTVDGDGLRVAVVTDKGLNKATGGLEVIANTSAAIGLSSSGVGVLLEANSGLEFNTDLAVKPNIAKGIEISATGVGITLATDPGLQFNTGLELKIEANLGLVKTSAGVKAVVDTNTGMIVDANGIGLKLHVTNPGLTSTTDGLLINLDTDPGLVLGVNGIKALVLTTSGLELTSGGIGLKLVANKGLTADASGLTTKLKTNGGLAATSDGLHISGTTSDSVIMTGTLDVQSAFSVGSTKFNVANATGFTNIGGAAADSYLIETPSNDTANSMNAMRVPRVSSQTLVNDTLTSNDEGIIFFDTTAKTFKGYNGSAWVTLG
jgi:hypothetical protein